MSHNPRHRHHLVALVLTIALAPLPALAEEAGAFDQSHGVWDGLLRQYVSKGRVDYAGLRSGGGAKLDSYLSSLSGVTKAEYGAFSRQEKMAFWFNAYNAFTVKLILDNYPTTSVMKIGGGEGAAFKQRIVPLGHLGGGGGAKIALNDVENTIIRRQFPDPRLHFVLVCAARSCPPLRSEAYTAAALGRQMEAQARAFIGDTTKNRYDAATNTLYLSRLFEWYAGDFQRGGKTVAGFVGHYLGGAREAAISAKAPQIEYLDYDWALNGR